MLEDDFNDVLSKAIRGSGANASSLGVDPSRLNACLNGKFDTQLIQEISPQLGLDTDKLLALPDYSPQLTLPEEIRMFTSPFGHLGVNAYLIESENHVLIFDTGTEATEMASYLSKHASGKKQHLFITHEHPDHVACLGDYPRATVHRPTSQHGESLQIDGLTITTLNVAGHASPANAYSIAGLEHHLCIVGDAIFAGSIGGCSSTQSYTTALKTIRENLLTLPTDTLLCPGHGRITTVQLELTHNPFL